MKREMSGKKVMIIAFSTMICILAAITIIYYYLDKNDPTKSLYYYPSTKSEVTDGSGTKYVVENIFPAYNNYDFFHEKRSVNYKTLHSLVGQPFDIDAFREDYEFSVMKYPENDEALEYGVSRYYVYDMMSDIDPTSIIYVNIDGIVVGITSPYLMNGEFKDITLSGANFSEITRLEAFMLSKDDTQFMQLYDGIYLSYAGDENGGIYSTSIHSDKEIMSLSNLIDFYEDEENYVSIYFSKFLDDTSYDVYKSLLYKNQEY